LSFDVFYQPCRFANNPVEQEGQTGEAPSVLLRAAELQAVRNILLKATAHGPDEHGCYVVKMADGGGAEVFSSDLAKGCMVAMRGMTPELVQFLFDLLVAGKWIMLPAMADTVAITNSQGNVIGIPHDFPRIVECASAEELGIILSDGVQAWARYRDQVVGRV
jgi:hypothetical protein